MLDIQRHKIIMLQILKDIYSDTELAALLGFKGGTALMFFHGLPRFSVDLDFNLRDKVGEECVFKKVRQILMKYGKIGDEAKKFFGLLFVLSYESGARNLKLEISNRFYPDSYELRDYLGISVSVMRVEDMFAHKFAALLDRNMLATRDVFDCWFFMSKRLMPNMEIIKLRTGCSFNEYLDKCCEKARSISDRQILYGIGELLDSDLKKWVKANLIKEFLSLAEFYKSVSGR
ncbi:MAG: nucleotidyl transferase AbiEii/AbiGii toxin family protein [Victivallales bacterium]|nr:nucleotidyl transferase AbiEii/AbiGii toxin family protein [Victivallales bacterium]